MKFQLYQPQSIHEIGRRSNQEDAIFPPLGHATANSHLFIVCDGMGGMEKGEVSSNLVCDAISNYLLKNWSPDDALTDQLFEKALSKAYDDLDNKEGLGTETGTTLAFLCLHRAGCLAAHIGDSRIYHIRPATNEILYRSVDHTQVQMLYDVGELTYWEMRTSQNRNVLRRAMQPQQDARDKADLVHITDIQPGDYFYLCSDGMTETMEDMELLELLADKQNSDEQKARLLVERTTHNSDNHSAHLLRIVSVQHEETDASLQEDETCARAANKMFHDPDYRSKEDITGEVKVIKPGLDLKDNLSPRREMTRMAKPVKDNRTHSENVPKTERQKNDSESPSQKGSQKNSHKWWLVLAIAIAIVLLCFLWPKGKGSNSDIDVDSTNKVPPTHTTGGGGSNHITPTVQGDLHPPRSSAPVHRTQQNVQENTTQENINNALRNASPQRQRNRTPQENLGTIVTSATERESRNSTPQTNPNTTEELLDGLVDE